MRHTCAHYYRHLGIADGMSVARVWACRYSKCPPRRTDMPSAMPRYEKRGAKHATYIRPKRNAPYDTRAAHTQHVHSGHATRTRTRRACGGTSDLMLPCGVRCNTRWSGGAASTPTLLRPALLRSALLRPTLLRPTLLRPTLLRPTLLRPTLLRPTLLRPALLRPTLLRPTLLRPALFRPTLSAPALLRPALLRQTLLRPTLLRPTGCCP